MHPVQVWLGCLPIVSPANSNPSIRLNEFSKHAHDVTYTDTSKKFLIHTGDPLHNLTELNTT